MDSGWDASTIAAVAALVVAVVAMFVALAQALQQYIGSGSLMRLGDRIAFGPMPGGVYRKWSWTQFRFRVLYRIPEVKLPRAYYGVYYNWKNGKDGDIDGESPLTLPPLWASKIGARELDGKLISFDDQRLLETFDDMQTDLELRPIRFLWKRPQLLRLVLVTHLRRAWSALRRLGQLSLPFGAHKKAKPTVSESTILDEKSASVQGGPDGRYQEIDGKLPQVCSVILDLGDHSEACWVSFWRLAQYHCTIQTRYFLDEGNTDRCPADLQVLPMRVSLQDLITVGCLMGLEVSAEDEKRRLVNMDGPAGRFISSPHQTLGTVVRFFPGKFGERAYDAHEKIIGLLVARIWGVASVAGRPISEQDASQSADENLRAELQLLLDISDTRERPHRRNSHSRIRHWPGFESDWVLRRRWPFQNADDDEDYSEDYYEDYYGDEYSRYRREDNVREYDLDQNALVKHNGAGSGQRSRRRRLDDHESQQHPQQSQEMVLHSKALVAKDNVGNVVRSNKDGLRDEDDQKPGGLPPQQPGGSGIEVSSDHNGETAVVQAGKIASDAKQNTPYRTQSQIDDRQGSQTQDQNLSPEQRKAEALTATETINPTNADESSLENGQFKLSRTNAALVIGLGSILAMSQRWTGKWRPILQKFSTQHKPSRAYYGSTSGQPSGETSARRTQGKSNVSVRSTTWNEAVRAKNRKTSATCGGARKVEPLTSDADLDLEQMQPRFTTQSTRRTHRSSGDPWRNTVPVEEARNEWSSSRVRALRRENHRLKSQSKAARRDLRKTQKLLAIKNKPSGQPSRRSDIQSMSDAELQRIQSQLRSLRTQLEEKNKELKAAEQHGEKDIATDLRFLHIPELAGKIEELQQKENLLLIKEDTKAIELKASSSSSFDNSDSSRALVLRNHNSPKGNTKRIEGPDMRRRTTFEDELSSDADPREINRHEQNHSVDPDITSSSNDSDEVSSSPRRRRPFMEHRDDPYDEFGDRYKDDDDWGGWDSPHRPKHKRRRSFERVPLRHRESFLSIPRPPPMPPPLAPTNHLMPKCLGSLYWLCQLDIIPGYWATSLAGCVHENFCQQGAEIVLEALRLRLGETSLLMWQPAQRGFLKHIGERLSDGILSWPPYAHGAQESPTEMETYSEVPNQVSSPFFKKHLIPVVLPEYNKDDLQEPGGLDKEYNDQDLCELIAVDHWLNEAAKQPEIKAGKSKLLTMTPFFVDFLGARHRKLIMHHIPDDYNDRRGAFREPNDDIATLARYMNDDVSEQFDEPEAVFLLLAAYRAMRIGQCIVAGIRTDSLDWVPLVGSSVYMA